MIVPGEGGGGGGIRIPVAWEPGPSGKKEEDYVRMLLWLFQGTWA